ncbi:MAG: WbqC family protein [Muribaculaceae bacterium]|nr:WbqC family protein [Muribaculaceae bacterium]
MTGYFGSIATWRILLQHKLGVETFALPENNAKALTRTLIANEKGERQTLSLPIAGGGHSARHTDPAEWMVSDHGRWTDVHLGAIQAAYGQSPYYIHYIDSLQRILREAPLRPYASLCMGIGEWVDQSIGLSGLLHSLTELSERNPALLKSRVESACRGIDPSLSIAHVIFHLGPEAIFTLLPAL